jgi:hypothetical protein
MKYSYLETRSRHVNVSFIIFLISLTKGIYNINKQSYVISLLVNCFINTVLCL